MRPVYRILLFLIISIWCAGIYFNLTLQFSPSLIKFSPFVSKCYSIVCHQQSEKLISICGIPGNVCGRCFGIYSGFWAVSFFYLFRSEAIFPNIRALFLFSAPMVIDVLLTSLGIYIYSKITAFFTGCLFGSIVFVYFYGGLQNLFSDITNKKVM